MLPVQLQINGMCKNNQLLYRTRVVRAKVTVKRGRDVFGHLFSVECLLA